MFYCCLLLDGPKTVFLERTSVLPQMFFYQGAISQLRRPSAAKFCTIIDSMLNIKK